MTQNQSRLPQNVPKLYIWHKLVTYRVSEYPESDSDLCHYNFALELSSSCGIWYQVALKSSEFRINITNPNPLSSRAFHKLQVNLEVLVKLVNSDLKGAEVGLQTLQTCKTAILNWVHSLSCRLTEMILTKRFFTMERSLQQARFTRRVGKIHLLFKDWFHLNASRQGCVF